MTFPSCWRRRRTRKPGGSRRVIGKPSRPTPFRRLVIESLEDRILLANDFWVGPTGGSWGDPSNWNNGLPGPADDVFLDGPAGGVLVNHDSGGDTVHS